MHTICCGLTVFVLPSLLCRLGIVHRDIKPENFLLGAPTLISAPAGTASGVLKISDFGVSAFYQPGEVSR